VIKSKSFNIQAWIDLKQFARIAYYLNTTGLVEDPLSISGITREVFNLLEKSLENRNLLLQVRTITEAAQLLKSLGITLRQLEPESRDRTLLKEMQREAIAADFEGIEEGRSQPPEISRQVRLLQAHEILIGASLIEAIDVIASGETDQMKEEEFKLWLSQKTAG